MRALMILMTSFCLINFSIPVQAANKNHKSGYRKLVVKVYADLVVNALDLAMEEYNRRLSDPAWATRWMKKEADQKTWLAHLEKNKKVDKLPKFVKSNGVWKSSFQGMVLSLSPLDFYKQTIRINGKLYKLKPGLPLHQNLARLQGFLKKQFGFKTTSMLETGMNLLFPTAEAIICGGFCIAILVTGVIAAGAGVAHMADKVVNGDKRSFEAIMKKLKDRTNQCKQDLAKAKKWGKYTSSYESYYDSAPGAFASFAGMKAVEKHLRGGSKAALEEALFKDLWPGNKTLKSCEAFASKFRENLGAAGGRDLRAREIMGDLNADDPTDDNICDKVEGLTDCLKSFNNKHRSHTGKRNSGKKVYKKDKGVYDENFQYDGKAK